MFIDFLLTTGQTGGGSAIPFVCVYLNIQFLIFVFFHVPTPRCVCMHAYACVYIHICFYFFALTGKGWECSRPHPVSEDRSFKKYFFLVPCF